MSEIYFNGAMMHVSKWGGAKLGTNNRHSSARQAAFIDGRKAGDEEARSSDRGTPGDYRCVIVCGQHTTLVASSM